MGGQTWVNLAGGGHTLPEETGASRLASTLMALTSSHARVRACMRVRSSPVQENLYHRDVARVRTQLRLSYPIYTSFPVHYNPIYLALPPTQSYLWTHLPPHTPPSTLPFHSRILFVCPLLLHAGAIHPKGLPTGCVSCDPDECVSVCVFS